MNYVCKYINYQLCLQANVDIGLSWPVGLRQQAIAALKILEQCLSMWKAVDLQLLVQTGLDAEHTVLRCHKDNVCVQEIQRVTVEP